MNPACNFYYYINSKVGGKMFYIAIINYLI